MIAAIGHRSTRNQLRGDELGIGIDGQLVLAGAVVLDIQRSDIDDRIDLQHAIHPGDDVHVRSGQDAARELRPVALEPFAGHG